MKGKMMRNKVATTGVGVVILVGVFAAGHFFCWPGIICPADGNPVGYHLHGLVRIVKGKGIDLTSCPTTYDAKTDCQLILNLTLSKSGSIPSDTPTPCPDGSNCANFEGTTMQESAADDYVTHTPSPVAASGAVEFSPPPPSRSNPSGATSRPTSPH